MCLRRLYKDVQRLNSIGFSSKRGKHAKWGGSENVAPADLADAIDETQIFYGAPSANMAINYAWPTRASLNQAAERRSSASLASDSDVSIAVTLSGGSGGNTGGDDARSGLSTAQISQDIYNDWSSGGSSAGTRGESSSTRPFHIFRGKKMHQIFPVRDCFVPPRHLSEPTTKSGLVSVQHALADAARPIVKDTAAGPTFMDTAGAGAPFGLPRAAHLPPMIGTSRESCSAGSVAGWSAAAGSTGGGFCRNKRPLARQQPPAGSSFERKLSARCEQWRREEEVVAEERAFREQARTQELLRDVQGLEGRGDDGGVMGRHNHVEAAEFGHQSLSNGGASHSQGNATHARQRLSCSRTRYEDDAYRGEDGGEVRELIPEREEELLTEMFGILDARCRGEVRLDEVLFYMTENAQVWTVY